MQLLPGRSWTLLACCLQLQGRYALLFMRELQGLGVTLLLSALLALVFRSLSVLGQDAHKHTAVSSRDAK